MAYAVPLYPLYALLFTDSGLSAAEISGFFVLWSAVGFVAEVPCGVWADRHSRRAALVLAGLSRRSAIWPGSVGRGSSDSLSASSSGVSGER